MCGGCSPDSSLASMDPPNLLTGEPGRSDPYLVLKLGKTVINERKNYVEDVNEVDLFKCYEFDTVIPGDPTLKISCYDYDTFGGEYVLLFHPISSPSLIN